MFCSVSAITPMAWAWVMPRAAARCSAAARSAGVSGPSAIAILIASARHHSRASIWSWRAERAILRPGGVGGLGQVRLERVLVVAAVARAGHRVEGAAPGQRAGRVAGPQDDRDHRAHPGEQGHLHLHGGGQLSTSVTYLVLQVRHCTCSPVLISGTSGMKKTVT